MCSRDANVEGRARNKPEATCAIDSSSLAFGKSNSVEANCKPTPAAVCGDPPVDSFFNIQVPNSQAGVSVPKISSVKYFYSFVTCL